MTMKMNGNTVVLVSVGIASLAIVGGSWIIADRIERAIRETNLSRASNGIGDVADKVGNVIDGVDRVVDGIGDWFSKFQTI